MNELITNKEELQACSGSYRVNLWEGERGISVRVAYIIVVTVVS